MSLKSITVTMALTLALTACASGNSHNGHRMTEHGMMGNGMMDCKDMPHDTHHSDMAEHEKEHRSGDQQTDEQKKPDCRIMDHAKDDNGSTSSNDNVHSDHH